MNTHHSNPITWIARNFSQLISCLILLIAGSGLAPSQEPGVTIARLTESNWETMVPAGKETDAILGDFVLLNEHLIAVIAQNVSTRNANMTVRGVGGCLIDLTESKKPNDQLSCFYPGNRVFDFSQNEVKIVVDGVARTGAEIAAPNVLATGTEVEVSFQSAPVQGVTMELTYRLENHDQGLQVVSEYTNASNNPFPTLLDSIRADRTFEFKIDLTRGLFSAHDPWFHQAYGIIATDLTLKRTADRGVVWSYSKDGNELGPLPAGSSRTIERCIIPARNEIQLTGLIDQKQGLDVQTCRLVFEDAKHPVGDAKLSLQPKSEPGAPTLTARTDETGTLEFLSRAGEYELIVAADGRPSQTHQIVVETDAGFSKRIELEPLGAVSATITDEQGGPIPCKVAFIGVGDTPDPNFGPDSRAIAIGNLRYSANGAFAQSLGSGKYDVLISHGPEYDAISRQIEVARGEVTELLAVLKRTVNTEGWVSADYHSHSTPSGDNTSDQLGRVLNLLAENIEFAPCTEHNRIDSYEPHLEALSARKWMATCCGMELTGGPLPINHQNSFPLLRRPRTQDGGGPVTDVDPIKQIQRLKMWDSDSEKLLQMNHPNLVTVMADINDDGKYDGGVNKMMDYVDVIEVHPPHEILTPATTLPEPRTRGNVIFNWLQLLNDGRRIPGVVNTDAHYNFHGSGWLRNYVASSTDDPAEIDTLEMVRNSKQGRVLMTNGPFMTVSVLGQFKGLPEKAAIGEDISIDNASITTEIEVQCANWLDINRVQIFLNGRPIEKFNFTRRTHPEMFGNGVSKFKNALTIELKEDSHIIVAAAGEGLFLGRLMGPDHAADIPIAVSNPIYVDLGGDGFEPNHDRLGAPFLMGDE